jgi:hypothetical protein
LFVFFILELVFRFLIPASQWPSTYYDNKDQLYKYDVSHSSAGLFTSGKFAELQVKWKLNNMGWNSDIDYSTDERNKPLITIIGDSYIEARQVNTKDNIAAKLREMVQKEFNVYSFGRSGFALVQYLHLSRHVDKYFSPEILVFNLVHNDFHESLCSVKRLPGWLCLEVEDSEMRESITPPNQTKRRFVKLLRLSSTARYLFYNLQIEGIRFKSFLKRKANYTMNIDLASVGSVKEEIDKATDYVFRKLKAENPEKKILFMMDAPRVDVYTNTINESQVLWLHKLVESKCQEYGFPFLDLTRPFFEVYRSKGVKFEFDMDNHWNEIGHRVAAEALFKKLRETEILSPEL